MRQVALSTNYVGLKKRFYNKEGFRLLLMSVPFIVFMLAFNYLPVYGWIYAFYDYKPGLILFETPFTGIRYFIEVFTSSTDLINALINTLMLNFLGIIVSPMPIFFAILINEVQAAKFRKFVQTFTTIPNFISWVLVFSMSFTFFSSEGMLNTLFQKIGLDLTLNPLGNNDIAWFFQTALGLWKGVGWSAIIYLAAIAGIDAELYDAAKVDGAGRFRIIWNITIPSVIPTYLVLLLLSISNMLSSNFDQYFVFYNPLVAGRLEVLDYYVYRMGVVLNNYPIATVVGIYKTVISVILLFTVNKIAKRLRGQSMI